MGRFNVNEEFSEKVLQGKGCCREYEDGRKFWENEKKEYHREDGPAIILPKVGEYYYLNGKKYLTKETWEAELWKRNIKNILEENGFGLD